MSYAKPNAPLILNPINLDKRIQTIQLALADALPWLDYSFGRAYRAARMEENTKRTIYYPEVYVGDSRYQEVTPNSHYGSHCFIQVSGAEKPDDYQKYLPNTYSADLEIIFLFNLETIKAKMKYPYQHHFTEELKRDIKLALSRMPEVNTITGIYETPDEVFKGYSYNQLAHQTFKHPSGGFKFGITTTFPDEC